MSKFLNELSKDYYEGKPSIDDAVFDAMAAASPCDDVGYLGCEVEHYRRMYSLNKIYSRDEIPFTEYIESPKLDGLAISLLYVNGVLDQAITRGNGFKGKLVTDKLKLLVPNYLPFIKHLFITGEVVAPKSIENSRNYASGAINLKSIDDFKTRVPNLRFIAYDVVGTVCMTYKESLSFLNELDFCTVIDSNWEELKHDGRVLRVNSNIEYEKLGFTAKFPRGAIALKDRDDEEVVETTLRSVEWQVGGNKVTPVAYFDEIIIGDAKVSKATLHNAGFIEEMKLEIGDTILVRRSGQVIPQVIGVQKNYSIE